MLPNPIYQLICYYLRQQRNQDLSEIDRLILTGIWQKEDYKTIAKIVNYQDNTVRNIASALLQDLSTATGQKITKRNFPEIFNQLALDRQATVDWEDAPTDIQPFCGRAAEIATLAHWILDDKCKLIGILGIGGIGKTSIATQVGQQLQGQFDFVVWRSLREAPLLNQLLGDIVEVLSRHTVAELPKTSPKRISALLKFLSEQRCLLILDNVEAIMNPGEYVGNYREGYSNYGELFHRLGTTTHQSCVLITSREPPDEITELAGDHLPIRILSLPGLNNDGVLLLQAMAVSGDQEVLQEISDRCQGNPLYLRIIASIVIRNFGGNADAFIDSNRYSYSKIANIITDQLARLTIPEKLVVYHLSLRREPLPLSAFADHFEILPLQGNLAMTIDSLIKRSIIQTVGSADLQAPRTERYTLQNVILELTTDQLRAELDRELQLPQDLFFFNHLALYPTTAPEYIREIQQRLFLQPLSRSLQNRYGTESVAHLQSLILIMNKRSKVGYGVGNLINLAISLRKSDIDQLPADLTNWDLSNLYIAEVDFQKVLLPGVNFQGSTFDRCHFSQGLGSTIKLSFSPDGKFLAASDTIFQIKIWEVATNREIAMLIGHESWVWDVQFSHDNKYLVSGSSDETLRIWEIASGECLQILKGHRDWVWRVNFMLNSKLVVSLGADRHIKLWRWSTGRSLIDFAVPEFRIRDGAFHGRRGLLAVCGDQGIKIWQVWLARKLQVIADQPALQLRAVAFSPDGRKILGSNFSCIVHCWDVDSGQYLFALPGHPTQVGEINFNDRGQVVTTCLEQIRVWNLQTGDCLKTINFAADCGKGFAYQDPLVATGSDNGTIKIWNLDSGRCISTAGGCAPRIMSLATNSRNLMVASSKDDGSLNLSDFTADLSCQPANPPFKNLRIAAHQGIAGGLSFSPNGKLVASTGSDRIIKIWDAATGENLQSLTGHTDYVAQLLFIDDRTLLSRSYDATTRQWDLTTGHSQIFEQMQPQWVMSLGRSADGEWIAFGCDTPSLLLLQRSTQQFTTYPAMGNRIRHLTFSHNDRWIIGATDDRTLNCWDVADNYSYNYWNTGTRDVTAIAAHPTQPDLLIIGHGNGQISIWNLALQLLIWECPAHHQEIAAISILAQVNQVVTCSLDGSIKLWQLQANTLLEIQAINTIKPYQGMQLDRTQGLNASQLITLQQLGADCR
jgi:WD40 repeat protein